MAENVGRAENAGRVVEAKGQENAPKRLRMTDEQVRNDLGAALAGHKPEDGIRPSSYTGLEFISD